MITDWGNALAALAVAYFFGWRRAAPLPSSTWRLWAFLLGVVALWAAVASPIAHLDRGHLTGHMIQHLLLMTVAAPLFPLFFWLAAVIPGKRVPYVIGAFAAGQALLAVLFFLWRPVL